MNEKKDNPLSDKDRELIEKIEKGAHEIEAREDSAVDSLYWIERHLKVIAKCMAETCIKENVVLRETIDEIYNEDEDDAPASA